MDSQSETLADCLNKIADKLEEMVGELKTYEAEGNEDIWKIPHDL